MNAIDIIFEKLQSWYEAAIVMLPNFIVAVILVFVFAIIAKYSAKVLKKIFVKFSITPAVSNLMSNVIAILIIGTGLFIALGVLDLQKTVTSLLAGVGILGLALGFAFQEIATNFISGIIISISKPFQVGDIVDVKDTFGKVEFVSLRTTNIRTFDGQKIFVPNKDVFQSAIVNYTENGIRRVDLDVGISYGEDLDKVEEVVLNAVKELDCIIKEKGVSFFYKEFDDSSINFVVRFWTEYVYANAEFLEAQHYAIKAIKKAFNENDITIPFPIRTLDFGIKGGERLVDMTSKTPFKINTKDSE